MTATADLQAIVNVRSNLVDLSRQTAIYFEFEDIFYFLPDCPPPPPLYPPCFISDVFPPIMPPEAFPLPALAEPAAFRSPALWALAAKPPEDMSPPLLACMHSLASRFSSRFRGTRRLSAYLRRLDATCVALGHLVR